MRRFSPQGPESVSLDSDKWGQVLINDSNWDLARNEARIYFQKRSIRRFGAITVCFLVFFTRPLNLFKFK